jgi:hypothetical protein
MPEFLAETYAPRGAPGTAAPRVSDAALDAEQVSQPGAPVRLLCAILVPEEETCFWLYRASSADAVRAAMTRTGLRPERITQPSRSGHHAPVWTASRHGNATRPPPPPDPPSTSPGPPYRTCRQRQRPGRRDGPAGPHHPPSGPGSTPR